MLLRSGFAERSLFGILILATGALDEVLWAASGMPVSIILIELLEK